MVWIGVALLGYFFNAVTAVLDKYLLSGPIKTPAVYAFFVAIFSLFALGFAPFGFHFVDWQVTGILLLSGAIFLYGLVAFYSAVQGWNISRIAPLVGIVVSFVAFVAIFLPGFSEAQFTAGHIIALLFLIIGGGLLAFDLPLKPHEYIPWQVLVAGMAMGVSLLLLKYGYREVNFVTGLVWSRMGLFLAGMSLFLIPSFRRQILSSMQGASISNASNVSTSLVFIVNKTLAGIGSFLVVYATFLGPVSFVQALSGMQYLFLLLLAFPLCHFFPMVYCEKLFFWDWVQRISAILFIGIGLWLAATSGVTLLV